MTDKTRRELYAERLRALAIKKAKERKQIEAETPRDLRERIADVYAQATKKSEVPF